MYLSISHSLHSRGATTFPCGVIHQSLKVFHSRTRRFAIGLQYDYDYLSLALWSEGCVVRSGARNMLLKVLVVYGWRVKMTFEAKSRCSLRIRRFTLSAFRTEICYHLHRVGFHLPGISLQSHIKGISTPILSILIGRNLFHST